MILFWHYFSETKIFCFLSCYDLRYSFICQGTSSRRQRSDLFGLRVKLPPVTTSQFNHLKVDAIPLSALLKHTTSQLAGLFPHYLFQMLNVKQKICECQLLKYSDRTLVYRLRGERSNGMCTFCQKLWWLEARPSTEKFSGGAGATEKTKPKNCTFNPPSSLSIPCMKI